jgi:uncharacterized protein YndB with AHSA1/START domain
MPDILRRVGINAPIEKVYEAITTQDGISAWWTRKVSAVSEIGAIMELRFKDDSLVMKIAVENLQPPAFVKWRVLAGLPEWVCSCVEFSLKDDDGETVVLFAHRDWKQAVEFMHHCSTKWGHYIFSLKFLVEEGRGTPHPDERPAGRWG